MLRFAVDYGVELSNTITNNKIIANHDDTSRIITARFNKRRLPKFNSTCFAVMGN
jgi:hypothetical protein